MDGQLISGLGGERRLWAGQQQLQIVLSARLFYCLPPTFHCILCRQLPCRFVEKARKLLWVQNLFAITATGL